MAMVRAQNEKSEEKGDPPPNFLFVCFFKFFVPNSKTPSPGEGFHPSRIFFFFKFVFKTWDFFRYFFLLQILTKLDMATRMAYTNFQQFSLVTLYKNGSLDSLPVGAPLGWGHNF
jgi:hypothetical protein